MSRMNCLRCGTEMLYQARENLQKGDCGPWVGNLNFSLQGGFEVDIYTCPKCGKIELFQPGFLDQKRFEEEQAELPPEATQGIVGVSMEGVPQVRCPYCGITHDFDYPECPKCGHKV